MGDDFLKIHIKWCDNNIKNIKAHMEMTNLSSWFGASVNLFPAELYELLTHNSFVCLYFIVVRIYTVIV